MGADDLDGCDSKNGKENSIAEKEAAGLGDQLGMVERNRAIKNSFKGRLPIWQNESWANLPSKKQQ